MRILKVIEKVFMLVSVIFLMLAYVFSGMLDENAVFTGIISGSVMYSTLGCIVILVLLAVGYVLYVSKHEKLGVGLLLAANVAVLWTCVTVLAKIPEGGELTSYSIIIALTGTIIFYVALIIYGARFFITLLNNFDNCDPELDPKVKTLTKWKKLQEQGINTEEEFEAKKKEILSKVK